MSTQMKFFITLYTENCPKQWYSTFSILMKYEWLITRRKLWCLLLRFRPIVITKWPQKCMIFTQSTDIDIFSAELIEQEPLPHGEYYVMYLAFIPSLRHALYVGVIRSCPWYYDLTKLTCTCRVPPLIAILFLPLVMSQCPCYRENDLAIL